MHDDSGTYKEVTIPAGSTIRAWQGVLLVRIGWWVIPELDCTCYLPTEACLQGIRKITYRSVAH
eukprot:560808-Amphidinium_carterae.2